MKPPVVIGAAVGAALLVIAASFLVGGRYSVRDGQRETVFLVDRYTGTVRVCTAQECRVVPEAERNPPPKASAKGK